MAQPTNRPNRIILSWSADCATTQSVTWRTSENINESFAELAEASDFQRFIDRYALRDPEFPESKNSFVAIQESVESSDLKYHSHSVTFTDLKPETVYCYRVGQRDTWSEWFTFKTGSQDEKPFSFIYFGDAQNGLDTVYPQLVRKAFLSQPDAAFAVFCGDLVDVSDETSWDKWFSALGFLAASYRIMPVPGNHEYTRNDAEGYVLSKIWHPMFTLPENGPESMKESCYTFVYNGVRMIGLDSTKGVREGSELTQWLENVLNNNKSRWTVVYFHHPVYSPAIRRNEVAWRRMIKPLLDKHRVDLVLQGHDHIYARTGLHTPHVDVVDLKNTTELDPDSRTVYVTSVAGAKMYELDEKPFFVKTLTNTQLFQIIHIDGNTLTLTAKTVMGDVIDSFILEKKDQGIRLRD